MGLEKIDSDLFFCDKVEGKKLRGNGGNESRGQHQENMNISLRLRMSGTQRKTAEVGRVNVKKDPLLSVFIFK